MPPSLRSAVENRICQAIVTGDLPPATHLPNRMMCDRFGVSRTVVREAIRLLEAELFEGWAGVEVDGRRAKG